MAYANLLKSDRLQRVMKLLQDGDKHDTRDIMYNADVCAVATCISELRDNGKNIKSNKVGKVWFYTLLPF